MLYPPELRALEDDCSSGSFPQSESQCFFRGFDLSGLSVAWQSERDIVVSFRSGYLTRFKNTASVIPKGTYVPEGFHTIVRDGESETAGRALSRRTVEFQLSQYRHIVHNPVMSEIA